MDAPKVGKPLTFKTPADLQKAIDEYFEWCDNRALKVWDDKANKEYMITRPEPYTMAGLAYALGISRQALMEYSHREIYGDSIKRARAKVEYDVERGLLEKGGAGHIFNLKNNFGWRDEQHTDVTSGGKPIPILGGALNVPRNDGNKEDPTTN